MDAWHKWDLGSLEVEALNQSEVWNDVAGP